MHAVEAWMATEEYGPEAFQDTMEAALQSRRHSELADEFVEAAFAGDVERGYALISEATRYGEEADEVDYTAEDVRAWAEHALLESQAGFLITTDGIDADPSHPRGRSIAGLKRRAFVALAEREVVPTLPIRERILDYVVRPSGDTVREDFTYTLVSIAESTATELAKIEAEVGKSFGSEVFAGPEGAEALRVCVGMKRTVDGGFTRVKSFAPCERVAAIAKAIGVTPREVGL